MMLLIRNRLRALTTKPPLMPDHHPDQTSSSSSSSSSHHSTNNNQTYLTSTLPSLFASSPLFIHFTNNNNNPLSVLHTNTFISPFGYPFSSYPYPYPYNTKSSSSIHRIELKNVGLAVISALKDEPFDDDNSRQPNNNVLFGTQLRLKIKEDSDWDCTRQVVSMELCEDYTCVISHNGPNTRTTHIFNNCIVDETYSYFPISETTFLTFCYTCNKHLDHTKDIFIYRGDKAFCSRECRYTEIMLDHNSESLTHILLT